VNGEMGRLVTTVRSWAAEAWQRGVCRRVSRRMRLLGEEFDEEMGCLRSVVDGLRCFRKHLLREGYD